jgi:hypothetical protein
MDERARAIRIHKQTRDILAQRLTERILEAEEEILAEAEGQSILSEIETIYDQIGLRLAHVNQMLGHLPASPEPSPTDAQTSGWPENATKATRMADATEDPRSANSPEVSISTFLALPAPGKTDCRVGALASSTLLMFAVHARRGDLEAAALSLEALFGLSREQALASTRVFHGHCGRDPSYVENAARLHNYLQADALSRAFGLMCESFGLSGGEALSALMWWRTQAAR